MIFICQDEALQHHVLGLSLLVLIGYIIDQWVGYALGYISGLGRQRLYAAHISRIVYGRTCLSLLDA